MLIMEWKSYTDSLELTLLNDPIISGEIHSPHNIQHPLWIAASSQILANLRDFGESFIHQDSTSCYVIQKQNSYLHCKLIIHCLNKPIITIQVSEFEWKQRVRVRQKYRFDESAIYSFTLVQVSTKYRNFLSFWAGVRWIV